jgi:hypothetical protein
MTTAINTNAKSERELTTEELESRVGTSSQFAPTASRTMTSRSRSSLIRPPPSCFECICDPHQRLDGPFASLMEKIMSKTNDTSYGAAATNEPTRELTADELDQIAGGTPSIPIPPPAPNVTVNGGPLGFVAPLHVARS